jgi:peptide/nickel transport system ATP-binding protein
MGAMSEAISISDLTVDFDGYKALDDVTLSVARGESFGLVGESGSG